MKRIAPNRKKLAAAAGHSRLCGALLAAAACLLLPGTARPETVEIARQGVLYPGGSVTGDSVAGQMHVFYQIPAKVPPRHYPILFIHGSRLTGASFLGTPDGRPGWATWFLARGWPVYVVDQPGKGRSGYSLPPMARRSMTQAESRSQSVSPLARR